MIASGLGGKNNNLKRRATMDTQAIIWGIAGLVAILTGGVIYGVVMVEFIRHLGNGGKGGKVSADPPK